MEAKKIEPRPVLQKNIAGTFHPFRERVTNTTLSQFRKRLKALIAVLDNEDGELQVRQYVREIPGKSSLSAKVGDCYVNFTFSEERSQA